jgi:hypothetical protein
MRLFSFTKISSVPGNTTFLPLMPAPSLLDIELMPVAI